MRQLARVLFCLWVVQSAALADPAADFVTGYIARKQVPGVAVLVRMDGKVVLSQGFGVSNLEHNVPVKPNTIFQSGSMGKQFTATAVMMLVEQNKVSLDDPISKYLEVPESWAGITVRHLLTHTSGLGDYPQNFDFRKDYTEEELLKIIGTTPLAFKPGEKWSYSNLGYVTLGILIHKVSGQFYGDFLKEKIFTPLGMKSTRIISEADIVPNRASGYEAHDGVLKNQEWVSPTMNTTADGSLYFTIEDLARWDATLEAESLLTHASYQQMYAPVRLNDGSTAPYGFGWQIEKTASGHKLIEHAGAWQGFTSHIARYVDDRVTVVSLCNSAEADCTYIAHMIAGIYKPELAPPKHVAKRVDTDILKAFEGQYRYEQRALKITSVGGALVLDRNGRKTMMLPESESSFFEEDSETTYRFVKQNGKVTALIVADPEEYTFTRVN